MRRELAHNSHLEGLSAVNELLVLTNYTELLKNLVTRDLKVRYRRSVLGFIWTMLNPLLMMVIFSIVFSTLFRFAIDNFIAYFLPAYLAWNFFAQSTTAALRSIIGNAELIKKIYVPKLIFVVSTVISGLINLLFASVPLVVVLVITTEQQLNLSWLFLPISVIAITLFTLGISLLLSAVAVFFYDVVEIYQVVLTAWMYLTPIFYPVNIVPHPYRILIYVNPLYYLIECFRLPLYKGVFPSLAYVAYGGVAAGFALVLGWLVFSRAIDRFAYYV